MAKGAQFDLSDFKKNDDGTYSKISNPQPRVKNNNWNTKQEIVRPSITDEEVDNFVHIKLTLFGIPMSKQSVRAYIKEDSTLGHFQPKKHGARTSDYIKQIKEQLPEGFQMFTEVCHVTKMHFVYPPLKAFHKKKGMMDRIRTGEIIYKNTRPDLPDNLKKLVNDAMSGIIYKDDGIIVTENDIAKFYGVGGCIIIEMKGR